MLISGHERWGKELSKTRAKKTLGLFIYISLTILNSFSPKRVDWGGVGVGMEKGKGGMNGGGGRGKEMGKGGGGMVGLVLTRNTAAKKGSAWSCQKRRL